MIHVLLSCFGPQNKQSRVHVKDLLTHLCVCQQSVQSVTRYKQGFSPDTRGHRTERKDLINMEGQVDCGL